MNSKEEYLNFLIMLTIRYNVDLCKIRLEQRNELNKKYTYDSKYNGTLRFKEKNIEIANNLFNVNLSDSLDDLDKLIKSKWEYIFNGLENKIFDYEWTMVDFKDTKNYEFYKYVNSYDLYWEIKIDKADTDPIYLLLNRIKWDKQEFYDMYKNLIDKGLFNPNRRKILASYEPFWCMFDHININDVARKLILDKRTNYQMLSNGSSIVAGLANFAMNESVYGDLTFEQKNILVDLLYQIVKKNNCSILEDYLEDNRYCDDNWEERYYETGRPLIFLLFKNEIEISRFDKMIDLYRYCISEDGVLRQIDTLKHDTEGRNRAIDFYISLIEKDNPENTNGIAMLKQIKI